MPCIGIAADLSAQRRCRGRARQRSERRSRHQGDTCTVQDLRTDVQKRRARIAAAEAMHQHCRRSEIALPPSPRRRLPRGRISERRSASCWYRQQLAAIIGDTCACRILCALARAAHGQRRWRCRRRPDGTCRAAGFQSAGRGVPAPPVAGAPVRSPGQHLERERSAGERAVDRDLIHATSCWGACRKD